MLRRLAALATGRRGERLAEDHLKAKGYAILARNYRVRGGEADLVARLGATVVVVEVKTRRSRRFGAPEAAVTRTKVARVLAAGRVFCRRHGIPQADLRGDVVAVEWPPGAASPTIRHYPNVMADPRA